MGKKRRPKTKPGKMVSVTSKGVTETADSRGRRLSAVVGKERMLFTHRLGTAGTKVRTYGIGYRDDVAVPDRWYRTAEGARLEVEDVDGLDLEALGITVVPVTREEWLAWQEAEQRRADYARRARNAVRRLREAPTLTFKVEVRGWTYGQLVVDAATTGPVVAIAAQASGLYWQRRPLKRSELARLRFESVVTRLETGKSVTLRGHHFPGGQELVAFLAQFLTEVEVEEYGK